MGSHISRPWTDEEVLWLRKYSRLNKPQWLARRLNRMENDVLEKLKSITPIFGQHTEVPDSVIVAESEKPVKIVPYNYEDFSSPKGCLQDIIAPLAEKPEYYLRGPLAESIINSLA